jgi:hypothetical protein
MKHITLFTGLALALAGGSSFAADSDTISNSGSNGTYSVGTTHRVRPGTANPTNMGGKNNAGVGTDKAGSASSGGSASDQSGTSMGGTYAPSTGTGGTSGAGGATGAGGGGR